MPFHIWNFALSCGVCKCELLRDESFGTSRAGTREMVSIRICLLVACTLLGGSCRQHRTFDGWNSKSGRFTWWRGEVALPAGFTYQQEPSDTLAGRFTSPDGTLVVLHDIGGYAGAYAARKNAFVFEERVAEGARVWTAKRHWPDGKGGRTLTLIAVTFPDSGCANFFLVSPGIQGATLIDSIAQSFRPNGRDELVPSLCR